MMMTATADPAAGWAGGGRRFKEDAVTRAAEPVVRHLSSGEAGHIRELAERIYANREYFVIETELLPVALIARDDLDDYLDWRDDRIQDLDAEEESADLRRVSISEVGDLGEIARRMRTNNECFVLEEHGVLPVAFIDPIDLKNYLAWREELIEALAESEQDAREGRTRPAEALLRHIRGYAASAGRRPIQPQPLASDQEALGRRSLSLP